MIDFIIIGERRSGTSTLIKWLEAQEGVSIDSRLDRGYFLDKEIRGTKTWFDGKCDYAAWEIQHNLSDYLGYFIKASTPEATLYGEKSADYLFWKWSHQRIKRFLPDVKLIVVLRNPKQRAWSMYLNEVAKGRESLSFKDALHMESSRCEQSDYALAHLSYQARGNYFQSLSELYKTFDKSQVKVLIFEEIMEAPKVKLQEICSWLGTQINDESVLTKNFNPNWVRLPNEFWSKNLLLRFLEKAFYYSLRVTEIFSLFFKIRFNHKLYSLTRNAKNELSMGQEEEKILDALVSDQVRKLKSLDIDATIWVRKQVVYSD